VVYGNPVPPVLWDVADRGARAGGRGGGETRGRKRGGSRWGKHLTPRTERGQKGPGLNGAIAVTI